MKKILLFAAALMSSVTVALAEAVSIGGVYLEYNADVADLTAQINEQEGYSATGTISFNASTKTLTLNNATIESTGDKGAIEMYTNSTLNIVSLGENVLKQTNSGYESCISSAQGSVLNISGSGSLTITSVQWYPIATDASCKITIDNTTVDLHATGVSYTNFGINNNSQNFGDVEIIKSHVKAGAINRVNSITLTGCLIASPADAVVEEHGINRENIEILPIPALGDTIQYAYKGNTLLYKIARKNSNQQEVTVVNDNWKKVSKPTGTLVIPDSVPDWQGTKYAVTAIYANVFEGCDGITAADFSENTGITIMSFNAFRNCTALETVTLSNSITDLWGYCFQNCPLNAFDFKNVSFIDNPNNFQGSNITEVNIPVSLTNIPDQTNLFDKAVTITCAAGNTGLTAADNVLYNKDKTKLISLPIGATTAEIHLPATVTSMLYKSMSGFEGKLYINSEIDPDYASDYNSPSGEIIVGCGLLDYYTTGEKAENFQSASSITEQLLWNVQVSAGANGSVAINDTTSCNQVSIEATPASGYKFVKWSDDDTTNPRVLDVTADVNLSAVFDVASAIANTGADDYATAVKVLRNGQLLIIRDGKTYTPLGAEIK